MLIVIFNIENRLKLFVDNCFLIIFVLNVICNIEIFFKHFCFKIKQHKNIIVFNFTWNIKQIFYKLFNCFFKSNKNAIKLNVFFAHNAFALIYCDFIKLKLMFLNICNTTLNIFTYYFYIFVFLTFEILF